MRFLRLRSCLDFALAQILICVEVTVFVICSSLIPQYRYTKSFSASGIQLLSSVFLQHCCIRLLFTSLTQQALHINFTLRSSTSATRKPPRTLWTPPKISWTPTRTATLQRKILESSVLFVARAMPPKRQCKIIEALNIGLISPYTLALSVVGSARINMG